MPLSQRVKTCWKTYYICFGAFWG